VLQRKSWRRLTASFAALALMAAACGGDGDETASPTDTGAPTGTESPTETTTTPGGEMSMDDIAMDIGVTAEPCPEAVNDGNGCIYLGIISDFSGPFQTFGGPITEGQQAFWQYVNEQGGVGGMFDVALPDNLVKDGQYNPQTTAEVYAEIEPQIAALAQTLGTPQTQAIIPSLDADNVIAATLTWWSGWEFEDRIIESGSNYCIDAMNGIDWMLEQGDEVGTVIHVGFPGDYGGDSLAGVKAAAEANDIEVVAEIAQTPVVAGGNVTEAVTAIVGQNPDVVFLSVGPQEAGQIIGGAAQNGYQGKFLGSHPVFLPDLMASAAGPAIAAMLTVVAPHESWDGDTPGHEALRSTYTGTPANDGVTFGWVAEYPILAALEEALASGDLTRAGIAQAATEMTVDYMGMLPETNYGGDSNETVTRVTTIGQPSDEATLKLATIETNYTGPTAEGDDFSSACVSLG
jgi:ABC-type branched-subunit amino acid transport system substrate-binding protein